jgi:hypothetical protein
MNTKNETFFMTMMKNKNYLGAYEALKGFDIPKSERSAYAGEILQATIEDLAISAKHSKEKTIYLRSVVTYISREFPGLANVYREQLRFAFGKDDLFTEIFKGAKNVSDVATGKKTFEEGVDQAKDDLQSGFESMFGTSVDSLTKDAEKFISQGLEQLSSLFGPSKPTNTPDQPQQEQDEPIQPIIIENEDDPIPGPMKSLDKEK